MVTDHARYAAFNPTPYTGEVTHPATPKAAGKKCSIVEAANYLELPPLLERYGEWAICEDGIHGLYVRYFIEKSRVWEEDWISHMAEKPWVDISDFIAALERAREKFGGRSSSSF